MPFFVPWTDLAPGQRARATAQWLWGHRANWTPDKWTFTSAAFVDGRPVGMQDVEAEHFGAVRSVETGSWLGRAYQGQGLGREMREAILHLAFAGLGAQEALSGAFEDNVASLATSRAVGYSENGEARGRGARDRTAPSDSVSVANVWESKRRDDIEIVGLEACLDMFIGPTSYPLHTWDAGPRP